METALMGWLRGEVGTFLDKDEDSCLALICDRTVEMASFIDSLKADFNAGGAAGCAARNQLADHALVMLSREGLEGVPILKFILMIEDEKALESGQVARSETQVPSFPKCFVDQSNPTFERSLELLREEFVTLAQQLKHEPSHLAEAQGTLVRMMAAWAALLYQCVVHGGD